MQSGSSSKGFNSKREQNLMGLPLISGALNDFELLPEPPFAWTATSQAVQGRETDGRDSVLENMLISSNITQVLLPDLPPGSSQLSLPSLLPDLKSTTPTLDAAPTSPVDDTSMFWDEYIRAGMPLARSRSSMGNVLTAASAEEGTTATRVVDSQTGGSGSTGRSSDEQGGTAAQSAGPTGPPTGAQSGDAVQQQVDASWQAAQQQQLMYYMLMQQSQAQGGQGPLTGPLAGPSGTGRVASPFWLFSGNTPPPPLPNMSLQHQALCPPSLPDTQQQRSKLQPPPIPQGAPAGPPVAQPAKQDPLQAMFASVGPPLPKVASTGQLFEHLQQPKAEPTQQLGPMGSALQPGWQPLPFVTGGMAAALQSQHQQQQAGSGSFSQQLPNQLSASRGFPVLPTLPPVPMKCEGDVVKAEGASAGALGPVRGPAGNKKQPQAMLPRSHTLPVGSAMEQERQRSLLCRTISAPHSHMTPFTGMGMQMGMGMHMVEIDECASPRSPAAEAAATRARCLERYRHKKAHRQYSKKIRYEMRKINADKRPRVKGRFIKLHPEAPPERPKSPPHEQQFASMELDHTITPPAIPAHLRGPNRAPGPLPEAPPPSPTGPPSAAHSTGFSLGHMGSMSGPPPRAPSSVMMDADRTLDGAFEGALEGTLEGGLEGALGGDTMDTSCLGAYDEIEAAFGREGSDEDGMHQLQATDNMDAA